MSKKRKRQDEEEKDSFVDFLNEQHERLNPKWRDQTVSLKYVAWAPTSHELFQNLGFVDEKACRMVQGRNKLIPIPSWQIPVICNWCPGFKSLDKNKVLFAANNKTLVCVVPKKSEVLFMNLDPGIESVVRLTFPHQETIVLAADDQNVYVVRVERTAHVSVRELDGTEVRHFKFLFGSTSSKKKTSCCVVGSFLSLHHAGMLVIVNKQNGQILGKTSPTHAKSYERDQVGSTGVLALVLCPMQQELVMASPDQFSLTSSIACPNPTNFWVVKKGMVVLDHKNGLDGHKSIAIRIVWPRARSFLAGFHARSGRDSMLQQVQKKSTVFDAQVLGIILKLGGLKPR